MSTDGGDPPNKPGQPPSTLAGVIPQQRPGLPPPRPGAAQPPQPFPPQSPHPPHAPYGQPQAGQPSQPPHGQQPHGQQPHGQQPHQQPHGQQPHGQQPHGQQPHGQQPHGQHPPGSAQQHGQHPPGSAPHGQQPQSYPTPATPAPHASPAQSFTPHAPPPAPPAGAPYQGGPAVSGRSGPIPQAQLLQSESSPIEQIAEVVGEVPGRFMGFLKISAKRAFRLRIEPSEVLPDERQALAHANPPIVDANLQAFLAWRRSVLFLVATILAVLSIMGLIDVFSGTKVASPVRFVKLLPTLAEVAFCLICWLCLRQWTSWRKQRKWLLIGWLLFMLMPFAVFAYPIKLAIAGATKALTVAQMQELGYHGTYNKVVAPFAFAMIAMFQLAPKVISLMPGLIRSAMVIKLLFPGAAAPGWLIVMCAPLYGMIAYAILVIPYQFTGEPWFMFGVLLIVLAQVLVMRSGFALAKPLTEAEAIRHIKRIRAFYMVLLITAAASIIGGLGLLVHLLGMKWTSVVTTILKFEANVMILTTIGADLVVTNLDRARGYTEGKEHIEEETEQKIAAFVGLNAPSTPPPPGPAAH